MHQMSARVEPVAEGGYRACILHSRSQRGGKCVYCQILQHRFADEQEALAAAAQVINLMDGQAGSVRH